MRRFVLFVLVVLGLLRGHRFLKLRAGSKKYSINPKWLPADEDLDLIVHWLDQHLPRS